LATLGAIFPEFSSQESKNLIVLNQWFASFSSMKLLCCGCQTQGGSTELVIYGTRQRSLQGFAATNNLISLFVSRHEVHSMNTHTLQNAGQ